MSHPPPDVANEMIARIIINKICSVFIVPTYGGQIPLFVHGLRLFQPNFCGCCWASKGVNISWFFQLLFSIEKSKMRKNKQLGEELVLGPRI